MEASLGTLLNLCLIIGFIFQHVNAVCLIDLRNMGRGNVPLVLAGENQIADVDGSHLLLPTRTSNFADVEKDNEVALLCAGNDNRLKFGGDIKAVNKIDAKCISGRNFKLGGASYPIQSIECTQEHVPLIKEVGTCMGRFKKLQIGVELPGNELFKLIDVCFDTNVYKTAYVKYTLVEGIERRQRNIQFGNLVDRTNFFTGLPSSPHSYYTCSNQVSRMNSLLGSPRLAEQYITCSGNENYLIKTHLASTSDFVYEAEQVSTYYYVNTVPMWHSIYNGNWKKLEEEIRLFAANMSREPSNLIIYTGTLEVTTLLDDRRTEKQIYLGTNNGLNVLPVPKWIWKVVYEPNMKEAIVFILVNNPYRQRFAACTCVCPQTKWTLGWNRQDRRKGYIYCCTVPNFRRVFSGLPQFEVTGLLTKNRPYVGFDLDVIPR